MTPELPRAPISEPWLIGVGARWPCRAVRLGQLAHHRLEGQRHVGPGVAVGHGVDVEAVDELLVGTQRVPVATSPRPPGRWHQALERLHAGDANLHRSAHGRPGDIARRPQMTR